MGDRSLPILPDSTGKRIIIHHHTELAYVGAAGPTAFSIDDIITGQSSGYVGVVNKIVPNGTAGTLIITPNAASEALNFTDGENLLVEASTIAQANGVGFPIYAQGIQILSYDNPYYGQRVDPQGAAFVRFAEGPAKLDAFGRLAISEGKALGNYIHQYSTLADLYFDDIVGSATITHESGSAAVALQCSTSDGDRVTRTTHKYHIYQAARSQLIEMTAAAGDTGKDNVVRRWGYYDDLDGVFFELSGSTLRAVQRSSTSGIAIDTPFNQSAFNEDLLDGSQGAENLSGKNLDVSKDNIYWIDLQWLGAGRVRYGVIIDGIRITAHSSQNANNLPTSYMRTATLPIRYEQINSGTAGSTSELRFFCATVQTEGPFDPRERTRTFDSIPNEASPGDKFHTIVFNQEEPTSHVLTVRPKLLLDGQTNRISAIPQTLTVSVRSDSSASIELNLFRSSSFTGSMEWRDGVSDAFEASTDGQLVSGSAGFFLGHWVASAGTALNIDIGSLFPIQGNNAIKLGADGTDQQSYAFTVAANNLAPEFASSGFTATFANTPVNVLSRSAGDFETDGFVAGHGIYVSGSIDNDTFFVIDTVTPLSMTFRAADIPETEVSTADVVVKGGALSFIHAGLNFREIF